MTRLYQDPEVLQAEKVKPILTPVLLDCPKCKHFISSEHIDVKKDEACCPNCGDCFSVSQEISTNSYKRNEVVMPEGLDVLKLQSGLDIQLNWLKSAPPKAISSITLSAFLWNLVLIPLVLFLAVRGNFIFLFFLGGHLFGGLGLLYQSLAYLFNKSNIQVTEDGISIEDTPFPSPFTKSRSIPRTAINQLFVTAYKEKIHRSKNKVHIAYALHARLTNGKTQTILRGLNKETMLYLEQEIETYYQIKDVPVRGEIAR